MKQIKAFDNQVTFHMIGARGMLHSLLIWSLSPVEKASKESDELPDMAKNQITIAISTMIFAVGSTAQIDFNLNPEHPDYEALVGLQSFWSEWGRSTDYVELFYRFMLFVTPRVMDIWYETYDQAQPKRLLAPVEMTVSTEALDPEVVSVD